jgi:hypothetical protein
MESQLRFLHPRTKGTPLNQLILTSFLYYARFGVTVFSNTIVIETLFNYTIYIINKLNVCEQSWVNIYVLEQELKTIFIYQYQSVFLRLYDKINQRTKEERKSNTSNKTRDMRTDVAASLPSLSTNWK